VNPLLDLKQKYAGVFEARYARLQATSAVRQGHTIMVFTIVTIIFVRSLLVPHSHEQNAYIFSYLCLSWLPSLRLMFRNSLGVRLVIYIWATSPSTFVSIQVVPKHTPFRRLTIGTLSWNRVSDFRSARHWSFDHRQPVQIFQSADCTWSNRLTW